MTTFAANVDRMFTGRRRTLHWVTLDLSMLRKGRKNNTEPLDKIMFSTTKKYAHKIDVFSHEI